MKNFLTFIVIAIFAIAFIAQTNERKAQARIAVLLDVPVEDVDIFWVEGNHEVTKRMVNFQGCQTLIYETKDGMKEAPNRTCKR